jgi:molybdopterin converting factor subunit 1
LILEQSARRSESIIVPRSGLRRGHPLVLPWSIASEVAALPSGQGVNAILRRFQSLVVEIPVSDSRMADDIDTPEDLRSWQEKPPERIAGEIDPARHDEEIATTLENSIRVAVRLFAVAKDRAGCSSIELELAGGSRVRDLRAEIARRLPGIAPLMENVLIAVNEEYADDEAFIMPGSRVAVIPPVSGGAGAQHTI